MAPSEIRIGNIIKIGQINYPVVVEFIGRKVVSAAKLSDPEKIATGVYQVLQGVPLTSEWMERYAEDVAPPAYGIGDILVLEKKGADGHKYFCAVLGSRNLLLKYVHQLQNLYLDLTGRELILKAAS